MNRRKFITMVSGASTIPIAGCSNPTSPPNSHSRTQVDLQQRLPKEVENEYYFILFNEPSSLSVNTLRYNQPDNTYFSRNKIIEFGQRQSYDQFKQAYPTKSTREVYTNLNFVNRADDSSEGCELCGVTSYENWDKDLGMERLGSKGFASNSGLRNIRVRTSDIFYDTFAQTTVRHTTVPIRLEDFQTDPTEGWYLTGETTHKQLTVNRYESADEEYLLYTYPVSNISSTNLSSIDDNREIPVMIDEPDFKLEMAVDSESIQKPNWMRDFSDFQNRITGYKYNLHELGFLELRLFPNPLPNCHIEYIYDDSVYTIENGRPSGTIYRIDNNLVQSTYQTDTITPADWDDIKFGGIIRLVDPRDSSVLSEFELTESQNNERQGDWLDPEYELTVSNDTVNLQISSVVVTGNIKVTLGDQTERISTEDGDYDGRGPYNPYDITFTRPNTPTELIFENTSEDRKIVLETIQ